MGVGLCGMDGGATSASGSEVVGGGAGALGLGAIGLYTSKVKSGGGLLYFSNSLDKLVLGVGVLTYPGNLYS